nr:MAG TPA: hypothetical protein [Caudoviricetes sp.]
MLSQKHGRSITHSLFSTLVTCQLERLMFISENVFQRLITFLYKNSDK